MADSPSIPHDLITRARAIGAEVLALVVESYHAGRSQERRQALGEAIQTCEQEGLQRAERFVDLTSEDMAAFEARFGAMPPSPVVAAYYDGVAEAVEACCARLRSLDDVPSVH